MVSFGMFGIRAPTVFLFCTIPVNVDTFFQAITLGYSNFAEMSMETKMATNIENVHTMIASLLGKGMRSEKRVLNVNQVLN